VDLIDGNLLLNKMKSNLHMFDVLMLNGVGGDVHDVNVIAIDNGAPR
jgi:hypothetical protein